MKKNEQLARAMEVLVRATESLMRDLGRRDAEALTELQREHGMDLAMDFARRTLRQRDLDRAPADVLLGLHARRKGFVRAAG